ncbi:helix-turn-helix domain-containing protein [Buttiauxella brennerae]|uniref:helix-turn-helix domain-containing protein n=1 Tax=Buttiauxella brennerae TaxID=82988 RepID=UPI0035BC65E0
MRLRYLQADEAAISVRNGGYVFSISEISRMLGIHRQTVKKIITDHKIESKGMKKKYNLYSVADVARWQFRPNWM